MITHHTRRDPGNPIVGLLLLLPVLIMGDYVLNDGQHTVNLVAVYNQVQGAVSAISFGAGGGIPMGIQLIVLLAVLGFIGYSMRGQRAWTPSATTKAAKLDEEQRTGVGYRQSRRARVASDIKIGETK